MTTNDQNKCAHLLCRCSVQSGDKYSGVRRKTESVLRSNSPAAIASNHPTEESKSPGRACQA
jgi:hypothetical protein